MSTIQKSSYEKFKLGAIVSFKTGKLNSNASTPNGDYPFFTCSQETFRTDTYSFDTEAVLLGGNNANGIYPLKYYKGKFDAYQRTYIIRSIDENKLVNSYLYFALRPQLDLLRSISTGAATKFLTLTILNEIELKLPPLPTQRKIASILSAYDDLIENNTRRIKILEDMAQMIYREWFVKFRFPGYEKVKMVDSTMGKIPEGWEVGKLQDFVELCYGKALKSEERKEGPYPVYGSSGVVGYHSESLVKGPGIIVGRKGNVGSVHWADKPFYPIDTVYYVKTKISLYYTFYNLQQQNFINNDAAVPGLNRNQAYALPFLIPAKKQMEAFDEVCIRVFSTVRNLRNKNENLRQTRDLLLPRLISGEVHINNIRLEDCEYVMA